MKNAQRVGMLALVLALGACAGFSGGGSTAATGLSYVSEPALQSTVTAFAPVSAGARPQLVSTGGGVRLYKLKGAAICPWRS